MPLPNNEKVLKLSQDILAMFDGIFGLHAGFRPAHAKGTMLTGTFVPSPTASSVSRAPHFSRGSTPITIRFSNSTGIPIIPDNDPNAGPRGLAIRFHFGEHSHTDIVSHSTDGFPTHTGDEFLEFLKALATSDLAAPSDPNNPKPIEKFLGTHPAALAFVQTPKPAATSFAREAYFGVTAYQFTSKDNTSKFGRYQIVPVLGCEYLDAAATAAKPADYLFDEIKERIVKDTIQFKLKLQLADAGDVIDNATVHWPASRAVVELGTLTLDKPVADNAVEQKQIIFDPIPRIDGIEASSDPLLELRAAIYLISGRRRRSAK